MQDLERYMNANDMAIPLLVKLALIHGQFETIHPFLDGNGRVGRLLITLMLCKDRRLTKPLVYISGYFEQNRQAYYDLLYGVSTRGAWDKWIRFFLEAVATQAADAIDRADLLINLQADFPRRVREKRASALLPKLVDELFASPSTTVADTQRLLKCTHQTASNLIQRLVDREILVEATGGKYRRVFYAPEILNLIRE